MAITSADFEYIQTLAKSEAGIVLELGKEYLVESRLQPIVRHEGMSSLDELFLKMKGFAGRPLRDKVIDALTTNETTFFRDIEPFEMLRKEVIPQLIEARSSERKITIWYAASSTGQEPYSLSMMIREHFPQLATWNLIQVATDLSPTVLAKAREGRYGQIEINRGLPANYLIKYFERQGAEWQLKPEIRSMVKFDELNLIKSGPPVPDIDIVMIRNVLIYFDIETKKQILARARRAMRPDGYLFLGGAETTMNLDEQFVRQQFNRSGCYRIKGQPTSALAGGVR
ncbi:MAG: protein-glutamate O-methyltransferase CheR [Vicinamibacterales bacterium]